jgi:hypothetical protein
MIKIVIIIVLAILFLLLIVLSSGLVCCPPCPPVKHIDCMPTVGFPRSIYCEPEKIKWIRENCPEILITW